MLNIAKRIQRELRDIKESGQGSDCPIKIDPVDDNYTKFIGEIAGPLDTPYEGAKFILDVNIPERYPFEPPKVRFVTKVWHPNIDSEDGEICLDILDNKWAPCMNLRTVMLSIQSLLSAAEANDPLDQHAAKQLCKKPELFAQTVRHWANVYAGGPNREIELEEKVKELVDLGHPEQKARYALSTCNWKVDKSLERINRGY